MAVFFALTLHPDDEGDGRAEFQGAPVQLPSNSQSTPVYAQTNCENGVRIKQMSNKIEI